MMYQIETSTHPCQSQVELERNQSITPPYYFHFIISDCDIYMLQYFVTFISLIASILYLSQPPFLQPLPPPNPSPIATVFTSGW